MTDTVDQAPEAPRRRLRYDPTKVGGADAYRTAQRHSRLVKQLRIVLPVFAILGVAVFWGTARFIPGDLGALVMAASIDTKTNSVVMDKPHISGFEGTRRAYEVKADRAVQSLDDPKIVTFEAIDGRIGLDGAGTAMVDAKIGVYDGNTNVLTLKDGISIRTTDGHRASIVDAVVNLGQGSLVTQRPIEINTSEGSIRANSMEVTERGKRIVFGGGVSLIYTPKDAGPAAPPVAAAGARAP